MKKLIRFILAFVLVFTLVGCGEEPTPTPGPDPGPQEETKVENKEDLKILQEEYDSNNDWSRVQLIVSKESIIDLKKKKIEFTENMPLIKNTLLNDMYKYKEEDDDLKIILMGCIIYTTNNTDDDNGNSLDNTSINNNTSKHISIKKEIELIEEEKDEDIKPIETRKDEKDEVIQEDSKPIEHNSIRRRTKKRIIGKQ